MQKDIFSQNERELYNAVTVNMNDVTAQDSLRRLSAWTDSNFSKHKTRKSTDILPAA